MGKWTIRVVRAAFCQLPKQWILGVAALLFPLTATADTLDPVRCLIEPWEITELSAPTAGVLAQIAVDRGDTVAKRQFLGKLDTTLEEIQLQQARAEADSSFAVDARAARLDFLQARADRFKALSDRNVTAVSQYEEALMEAEVARQDLQEARLNRALAEISVAQVEAILAQKTLTSPVDGVVVERRAAIGEYQDGTQPILTLAVLDPLRVEAFVPLSYYKSLAPGQTVTIAPEAPIEGRYQATIAVVDRVFDAGTGTVGVRIELPNPDLSLPAGLRCSVIFGAG